jgi:hypothetical protein
MKKVFVLFSIFFPGLIAAQESVNKHSISILAGNGGQIIEEINSFYSVAGGTFPNRAMISVFFLKFNYEVINDRTRGGGRIGYGWNEKRNKGTASIYEYRTYQQFYNISLFGSYRIFRTERFEFAAGPELIYYYVDDYYFGYTKPSKENNYIIEGGNIIGLNNITSGKFFISNNLFLSSEIAFGFIRFDLGGKYQSNWNGTLSSGGECKLNCAI